MILIGDSEYLVLTFKMVVEHLYEISLTGSRLQFHVAEALKILLTLVKHTSPSLALIDPVWINELLRSAADDNMPDEEFILLLKLSAWRKERGAAVNAGAGDFLIHGFGTDPQALERTATSQAPTPDDTLFRKVMETINGRGLQEEVAHVCLLAIRDIRRLGPSLFDDDTLQTVYDAMRHSNPLGVRRAIYDVVLVMQDQWLKSEQLRWKLEDLDFFERLHNVVAETGRSDYQRSFLLMMEILSGDVRWHSYLRKAMHIWLPFRHEGEPQTLRIIANFSGLEFPKRNDQNSSSLDDFLQKLMVGGWAAVPRWPVRDLTADGLKPLAEITEGLLFDDDYLRAVLAEVEQVIPGLKQ